MEQPAWLTGCLPGSLPGALCSHWVLDQITYCSRAAGCASAINTNKVTQIQAQPEADRERYGEGEGEADIDRERGIEGRASHGFGAGISQR